MCRPESPSRKLRTLTSASGRHLEQGGGASVFVFCTVALRAESHVFPLGVFVVSGQRIQARRGSWESLSVPGFMPAFKNN